jgi:hypothetical protein
MAVWLMLWALTDWRVRRMLAISFGATMAGLLIGAEILLPGWWRMFAYAIAEYHQYTQNQSVIELLLGGIAGVAGGLALHLVALILASLAVLASAILLWKLRKRAADSFGFGAATALVLALTVLVVPMSAPYNQVLLLPAILLLARERTQLVSRSLAHQFVYWFAVAAVVWQWIASLGLTAIDLLVSQERAFAFLAWPFFAMPALPVAIFVLMFIYLRGSGKAIESPH